VLPDVIPLPNLVFTYLPNLYLLISYQLETAATDVEWDAYIVTMATALRSGQCRSLVVTEGAHPTREQQQRMIALVKGKPGRTAVLSAVSGVRFVVSVYALMKRDIRAYAPREYEAAFTYLDLAAVERPGVLGIIDRLREKLDPPEPVTVRRKRSELR
jgi:hypothetical protein